MSVWEAVVPAGEVIGVQLIRRKRDRGDCRGYGEQGCLARLAGGLLRLQRRGCGWLVPGEAGRPAEGGPLGCRLPRTCKLVNGCSSAVPLLPTGFVRMANKEAAEAACESVKEVGVQDGSAVLRRRSSGVLCYVMPLQSFSARAL